LDRYLGAYGMFLLVKSGALNHFGPSGYLLQVFHQRAIKTLRNKIGGNLVITWTSSARVLKQNGTFVCIYVNQYSV